MRVNHREPEPAKIRLRRWEYQKVTRKGYQEGLNLLDSVTLNLGEKYRPKRTKTWLLGTK